MNTRVLGSIAACMMLAISSASIAAPAQVVEKAHVPGHNGSMTGVEMLKSGKKLETVSCHDFGMLEETFRPQAVVYAANYGPKGKAHPTVTIDGVENIVPMVVAQCKAQPGDHFLSTVNAAVAAAHK